MGSFGNSNGFQINTNIYDLTVHEINIVVNKLEADNMRLLVKLNDKDEEILRLKRELLSQKKETLRVTRKVEDLVDQFKNDQVHALDNFLWELYNAPVENQSSLDCSSHCSKQGLAVSGRLETPTVFGNLSKRSDDVAVSDVLYSNDVSEQHVKAPLSYKYQHLRVQVCTNATEDGKDDDKKYSSLNAFMKPTVKKDRDD